MMRCLPPGMGCVCVRAPVHVCVCVFGVGASLEVAMEIQ